MNSKLSGAYTLELYCRTRREIAEQNVERWVEECRGLTFDLQNAERSLELAREHLAEIIADWERAGEDEHGPFYHVTENEKALCPKCIKAAERKASS